MNEIIINNWLELQDIIFKDVYESKIGRYRADYIYRGISNKNLGMKPKLNRVCAHNLELEKSIIRNFKKYGYTELNNSSSIWHIISIGQHYGLPTRLLDWTYSPLVAAHFATEDLNEYDKDGAIYALDFDKLNRLQLPKRLLHVLLESNSKSFSMDMLDSELPTLESFENYQEEPFCLFFEPSSISDRIVNQYALFSTVSKSQILIDDIINKYPNVVTKIIIPAKTKLEIRDKLDYINISERLLYPGLDGLCSWITRRYSEIK